MKRRSRAVGEASKARRRKVPKPQRRNAPKATALSISPPTGEEAEVARLARELSDERRQRTATSEVLCLLSGSHGDLNHLFDTILANATNLCQANFGTLSLYEGDAFRIVAMHNVPPGLAELRRREPLVRAGPLLRIAETKQLLHIADYTEYVASHPADSDAAAFAKLTGVRTTLEVPMLKNDEVVGAIVIYRTEVRSFDDREIVLIKDFAAQAVIAIENARLLNALRQRTTDLTERTTDLTEALEQQTATSDVLKVISSSPGICSRSSIPCSRTRRGSARRRTATCGHSTANKCMPSRCGAHAPFVRMAARTTIPFGRSQGVQPNVSSKASVSFT